MAADDRSEDQVGAEADDGGLGFGRNSGRVVVRAPDGVEDLLRMKSVVVGIRFRHFFIN